MDSIKNSILALIFSAAFFICASAGAGTITYDHDCFIINGKDTALYGGSMHYFRCAPELWKDRLLKMKAAGVNVVTFYSPWNYHEPVKGKADFSELAKFIDLCKELDLYVISRWGPYICGEWDNGGYPEWLIKEGISSISLRTDEKEYVKWVRYWYKELAEVIRPRLLTHGGNVILIQVENEYGKGGYYKTQSIRTCYNLAMEVGADVPIVTCNTDCAWDNDDPVMARIVNGNNSGVVRWSNIQVIDERTLQARHEENNAPTIVLENPGGQGMFSGLIPMKILPLDARDLTAVNKTIWMQGGGLANYYMFYGGTNFEYWGAGYQSTTYACRPPVECPISEPGGLGESYYAVKLIGQWLKVFGSQEVRSIPMPTATSVTDCNSAKPPMVLEKVNGDKAFIFIREQEDRNQQFRVRYTDPATSVKVVIPSSGKMTLPAKGMIILACNTKIGNRLMKYCTSEILGIEKYGDKSVVVVYGPAGSKGEICFDTVGVPQILPESTDYVFDEFGATICVKYKHEIADQFISIGDILLVVTDNRLAQTCWFAPSKSGGALPIISNNYFLSEGRINNDSIELNTQTTAGTTMVSTFLPSQPKSVQIDGKAVEYKYDKSVGRLSVEYTTLQADFCDIVLNKARFTHEDFSAISDWRDISLMQPLEEQGIFGKGYVMYSVKFNDSSAEGMIVRFYEGSGKTGQRTPGDPVMFFINGQYVSECSGYWHDTKIEFDPKEYLKKGSNDILVVMERLPRHCSNPGMNEPKGLAAVSLVGGGNKPWQKVIDKWRIKIGLPGQDNGYYKPDFDDSTWKQVSLGSWKKNVAGLESYNGVGWYRFTFDLAGKQSWQIPLYLSLDLSNNALIYLNGRMVTRYHQVDWQRDFYLPDSWLNQNGHNVIAIAVRNDAEKSGLELNEEAGIKAAAIKPYKKFVVKEHQIKIRL